MRQLDDMLLVSGCLQRVVVPALQPGEIFRHSLQLCALTRGSFYLESRVDAVPLSHLLAERKFLIRFFFSLCCGFCFFFFFSKNNFFFLKNPIKLMKMIHHRN